ncbi:YdcF family protein [Rickettsiales endosymbiont of Peranema trichophorum]|uniref:YdcF family protein n=1 Tax=Rickettsiales endosymbiont of Peranema trichophorum TaxID=2486577 RepID=UPI001A928F10|nr:YdcF family protein [Rickettsiales endosymbiont of Peranema trichophorum]
MYVPKTVCQTPELIVVLTGDNRRVEEGFKYVAQRDAKAILISGIGHGVSLGDFENLQKRFNVVSSKVFLGGLSRDTVGNAIETSAFMKLHSYTRVCVVTSSYHIPRSSMVFQKVMPHNTVGFIEVVDNFHNRKYQYVKKRFVEYVKLMITLLQSFVDHTF